MKDHFSYTSLRIPCPRAFIKHYREDKIDTPIRAVSQKNGEEIHELLEGYVNDDVEASEILNILGENAGMKTLEHIKKLKAIANEVKTEEWIELSIEGEKFVGRIDLLIFGMDAIYIVDYKSTYQIPHTLQDREQLEYYALPFLLDGKGVFIGKLFVRAGELLWHNEMLTFEKDYSRIENRLKRKIKERLAWIQQENLATSPSWYCSYCPYRLSCETVEPPRTAEELALEKIRLEAKLQAINNELKEYTKMNGFVEVEADGNVYKIGHHESETVKPLPDAIDRLIEKGEYKLLKPDTMKLKRRKDLLGEIYEIRTTTRFTAKKEKANEIRQHKHD